MPARSDQALCCFRLDCNYTVRSGLLALIESLRLLAVTPIKINNLHPAPEQGDDIVQIAFPMESTTTDGIWVTTGLLCKADRVNL